MRLKFEVNGELVLLLYGGSESDAKTKHIKWGVKKTMG